MTRALEQAEAQARKAVDEWIAAGNTYAASPGACAIAMFDHDQKLLARVAEAFEVEPNAAIGYWSAYGLALARNSIDTTFAFSGWLMPWAPTDIRARMLESVAERFGEAAIIACRARSSLQ